MADWKALCEELAEYLALLDEPPHELVCRAQEALAQPEPEAVGPTDEELFRIASDCAALYIADDRDYDNCSEVMAAMRAAIAADRARFGHQPAPPAEGEVGELVTWLRETGDLIQPNHLAEHQRYKRAADLLEQRHPTPVPVAERLPGPEDCDAEHYCWRWNTIGGLWARQPLARSWYEFESHWLPATALPLPQGEVE